MDQSIEKNVPANIPTSSQTETNVSAEVPTTSMISSPSCSSRENKIKSPGPEVIRPYPQYIIKSGVKSRGKPPGKSRILTATPEKNRIEQALMEKKEREKRKEERKLLREMKAKKKLELESIPKQKAKRPRLDDSSSDDCTSLPEYMESDDSPYHESFSEDEIEEWDSSNFPKIDTVLEKYYAIFYDINWYLGRVIDFPDEGETKIKFLKMGLGNSYEWPKDDDIQTVKNKFIFYGPIHLIGNGPFYIDDKCRRRIDTKYKQLKKNN